MTKSLQVYAVGGCGLKLAHNHLNTKMDRGFAKPTIAVLDSSKSDVDDTSSNQQIFHTFIEAADGMGKDRSIAGRVIKPYIEPLLDNHSPGKVNIVIFSLSGGTGSVGGPLLVKELLSRNENVIAMVVANTTNQRETTNTISTLKDLNKIVKEVNKPLNIMYYENSSVQSDHHANVGPITTVNQAVAKHYRRLCCLLSGDHIGIDSKDVTNFLNYQNVSKTPAKLIELYTSIDDEELSGYDHDIESAMVLSKDPDYTMPQLKHRYEVKGTWSSEIREKVGEENIEDVLFCVSTDAIIKNILGKLMADVKSFQESEQRAKFDAFDDLDLDGFGEDVDL